MTGTTIIFYLFAYVCHFKCAYLVAAHTFCDWFALNYILRCLIRVRETLWYRVNENKFNPTIKINEKIPAYISISLWHSHKNTHTTHPNTNYLLFHATVQILQERHSNYVMISIQYTIYIYSYIYISLLGKILYTVRCNHPFLNWQERSLGVTVPSLVYDKLRASVGVNF